ncbi:MAG: hypothetical protein GH144_00030 [Clostridia bacterium]|nr:hypothetical protein [Clostridia bacterium]
MDNNEKQTIGIIGQYGCMGLILFAIGFEVALKADLGYVLITVGAVLYSIFTKIRGR